MRSKKQSDRLLQAFSQYKRVKDMLLGNMCIIFVCYRALTLRVIQMVRQLAWAVILLDIPHSKWINVSTS